MDQFQAFGTNVDVLAGGAGGFHMWIDQSQGLVFTFSTDLTEFENVEPLSARMHQSIVRAVGVPEPSTFGFVTIGLAAIAWRRRRNQPRTGQLHVSKQSAGALNAPEGEPAVP